MWTVALVLFGLWFVGLMSGYTLGGFVHILLAVAIVVVVFRVIVGRELSTS